MPGLFVFCGGEAEIRMDTDSSGGGLYVYAVCTGCGIHGAPVWALPGVKERRAAVEEVVRGGNRITGKAERAMES